MAELGFADLDLLAVATMVAACFVAAVLGGLSGFGAGLLITLFIAPIVGPKAVIPVLSVAMLMTNASRVWVFRAELASRPILLIAVAGCPFAVLGAMTYVRLDSCVVQLLLGAVLMASIPLRRWLARRRIVPGTRAMVTFGGVYGFLSSVMVGAGMLVIPMLIGIGLAGASLIASDAAIAVAKNVVKMLAFGQLDALGHDLLLIALVIGAITIPGTQLAAWIVRRTRLRVHTALVEALIVVGGVWMTWDAVDTRCE